MAADDLTTSIKKEYARRRATLPFPTLAQGHHERSLIADFGNGYPVHRPSRLNHRRLSPSMESQRRVDSEPTRFSTLPVVSIKSTRSFTLHETTAVSTSQGTTVATLLSHICEFAPIGKIYATHILDADSYLGYQHAAAKIIMFTITRPQEVVNVERLEVLFRAKFAYETQNGSIISNVNGTRAANRNKNTASKSKNNKPMSKIEQECRIQQLNSASRPG
ncbi:hypothetical protein B0T19DRAFT_401619 [Cercophora scortea]|uniref:Uncharacterized protein n=1 Tax=Cercophora scortea TaxID=314031 RepID=A0AAE0M8J6_9PEZI|nr:hypothetical protein B0T19DRAFT_401619 [Cercophora scortea]